MEKDFPSGWMWSHAFDMLARAERMHREIFRPGGSSRRPAWEPPVDILETPEDVLVLVALPGVIPEQVEAVDRGQRSGHWRHPRAATRMAHRRHSSAGAATGPFRAPYPFACRPLSATFTAQPVMAAW